MKKFLSTVLALVMALSLCVPAFAADTVLNGVDALAEDATVEVTGTTKTAEVKVTVPTTGSIVLNPYELQYEVSQGVTDDAQIISSAQYIVNESDLPIKVSTTVTGTIEGTAEFQAADATAVTDKKAVHLEFNIGATSNGTTESSSYETKALAKTATPFTDITMDKKGDANPAISFKFTGDAAKNPDSPWTTEDVIGATIVFSFALDNSGAGGGGGGGGGSTTYTVTKGTLTGNDNGGDITIDKTTAAAGDTVTVTVSPDGTNTNVAVTVTGADSTPVTVSGSGPYTFTMPAQNVTVTATFTA